MKTINAIAKKSAKEPNAVFDDLMRIIIDEDTLYQAMGTVSKKKGALTPGTKLDSRTADDTSKKLIKELVSQLKHGTFRFKPIRRIYMDKSGKNPIPKEQLEELTKLHAQGKITMEKIKELKARPLGIPSFPDKIVQEAIRMILAAIYEPEFARLNVNFGFRAGLGCQDAILHIKQYSKQMDYAIEGDIKGAFDNVEHDRLINILRKKVKDEKFLKLIIGGLKCGVMFLYFRQDSELGTTQGSIVSPLLYNIYFHEFDKFIETNFREKIKEINTTENRTDRPFNKLYNFYKKKKERVKLKEKLTNLQEHIKMFGFKNETQPGGIVSTSQRRRRVLPITYKDRLIEFQEASKKYKQLDTTQKTIPTFAKSRQTIRFSYTRYADDWIFLTNAQLNRVQEWKEMFAIWMDQAELRFNFKSRKNIYYRS